MCDKCEHWLFYLQVSGVNAEYMRGLVGNGVGRFKVLPLPNASSMREGLLTLASTSFHKWRGLGTIPRRSMRFQTKPKGVFGTTSCSSGSFYILHHCSHELFFSLLAKNDCGAGRSYLPCSLGLVWLISRG